jgi:hypothetical protein
LCYDLVSIWCSAPGKLHAKAVLSAATPYGERLESAFGRYRKHHPIFLLWVSVTATQDEATLFLPETVCSSAISRLNDISNPRGKAHLSRLGIGAPRVFNNE